jgi:hypothetical protein
VAAKATAIERRLVVRTPQDHGKREIGGWAQPSWLVLGPVTTINRHRFCIGGSNPEVG